MPDADAAIRGGLGFRDEAVAYAADGEEVDGVGGVGLEVAAEADDEVVDGAGVGVFADVPDVFEDFLAGDDFAGAIDQVAEEVGFHEGEMGGLGWCVRAFGCADFEVFKADGAAGEGEVGDWGKSDGCLGLWRVGLVALPVHAAEQGGEAGEEDGEVEGLGEVVVGAGGEAFDDVFGASAGGEEQDRGEVAGFAQGADDGEAVAAGEHDVEEDGGGLRVGGEEPGEGGVAVGFVVGAVAFGFEVEEETLGEVFFVFYYGDEGLRVHVVAKGRDWWRFEQTADPSLRSG